MQEQLALLFRDLISLAERLTEIDGLEEICITTNGVLLEEYADGLFKAGIRHINISLDSLNPERFAYITGFDLFEQVWRGIEKVLEKGFSPIKINSVIIKGINDNEITALAGLSLKYPVQVRFIEFMPVGHDIFWNPAVLQHYLDGILFALGDLPADVTPSGSKLQVMEKLLSTGGSG